MTSIVSIVAAFMATFMLVFGYLTYSEQDYAEAPATAAAASELDR
jgi:hypothetical protein